jgi:hypothetical protein
LKEPLNLKTPSQRSEELPRRPPAFVFQLFCYSVRSSETVQWTEPKNRGTE